MKKTIAVVIVILAIFVSCQTTPKSITDSVLVLMPADGLIYLTIKADEWPETNNIYKIFSLYMPDISDKQLESIEEIDYFIISFNKIDGLDVSILIQGNFPSLKQFMDYGENQTWRQDANTWYNLQSSVFISEPYPGTYFIRTRPDSMRRSASPEQQGKFKELITKMHESTLSLSVNIFDLGISKSEYDRVIMGFSYNNDMYRIKTTFTYNDKVSGNNKIEYSKLFFRIWMTTVFQPQDAYRIMNECKWEIDKNGNVVCVVDIPKELFDDAENIIDTLKQIE